MKKEKTTKSEIIIYQTADNETKIQTRLEDETVWLTQEQMAQLFGKGRTTITEHIGNIFKEGELNQKLVCRDFRHTTQHGAIAGKTSHQDAIEKAKIEYEKFRKNEDKKYISDFDREMKRLIQKEEGKS